MMHKRGVNADTATFVTMMAAYSKLGDVQSVKDCIQEMETRGITADSSQNILLSAYTRSNDIAAAETLFKTICSEGSPQITSAYNIMLQAYNNSKDHDKVVEIYELMVKKERIVPDRSTYDVLIDAYSKTGDLESVLEFVKSKDEAGHKPSTYQYNSILRLYLEKQDFTQVITTYQDLIHCHVRPDQVTFTYILEAYHALGETKNLFSAFFSMQRYQVVHNSSHFACLAKTIGKNPDMEALNTLLESTTGRNIHSRFIVQILEGMCELGDPESARFLYNHLITSFDTGLDIFNHVLRIYASYKFPVDEILKVLDTVKQLGFKANSYTYNQVLRGVTDEPTRRSLVVECLNAGHTIYEHGGNRELVDEIWKMGGGSPDREDGPSFEACVSVASTYSSPSTSSTPPTPATAPPTFSSSSSSTDAASPSDTPSSSTA